MIDGRETARHSLSCSRDPRDAILRWRGGRGRASADSPSVGANARQPSRCRCAAWRRWSTSPTPRACSLTRWSGAPRTRLAPTTRRGSRAMTRVRRRRRAAGSRAGALRRGASTHHRGRRATAPLRAEGHRRGVLSPRGPRMIRFRRGDRLRRCHRARGARTGGPRPLRGASGKRNGPNHFGERRIAAATLEVASTIRNRRSRGSAGGGACDADRGRPRQGGRLARRPDVGSRLPCAPMPPHRRARRRDRGLFLAPSNRKRSSRGPI